MSRFDVPKARSGRLEVKQDFGYGFNGSQHSPNRFADRFQEPMWGYLATICIAFLGVSVLPGTFGLSNPTLDGAIAAVVAVFARYFIVKRLNRRQERNETKDLLHAEAQRKKERDVQIARAKASGDFDRFSK